MPTGTPCVRLESSYLDADRDLIARTANVVQSHGNRGSRRDAAWHADVDLIQPCVSRSLAEKQHFGHQPTDRDLRRNHAAIDQSCAKDLQRLSSNRRIVWRDELLRRCMQDRALAVSWNRQQHRRRPQYGRMIDFSAGKGYAALEARLPPNP